MVTTLITLILIVTFLLIVVIMVQNPKGGGLSSAIGGGGTNVVGGVKKTGDFLDKSTWTLVTLLAVLIIGTNTVIKKKQNGQGATGTEEVYEADAPDDTPAEAPVSTESEDTDAPDAE